MDQCCHNHKLFFDLALFTILIISAGQVGAEKKLAELLFIK